MSRVWTGILASLGALAACALPAHAQYVGHVDTQPANPNHLRATAVLEYTGDLKDIKASRLVPIAVWDGVQYQPGGLFLAQPAPLAVLSGTQYELESDGKSTGFFNVKDSEYLAGLWIGVGSFEAPAPPAPRRPPADSGHAYAVTDNADPDKPHFAHRPPPETNPNADGSAPASADAGHPTLHARTGDNSGGNDNAGSTSSQPALDSERPTFHRHTSSPANQMAIDPDRPRLSYTSPESQEKLAKPDALFGLPADMKQIAGISDSNPVSTQTFAYSWANPEDAAAMQSALETVAQQAVAPPAPPAVKPAHATRHKPALTPPLPALADVDFRVFGLTFGGGATMVLTGHTTDTPEKYVTIIAQPDFYGKAQILLKQVSTDNDLDVAPRMRLIDAVDTQGNNRGDLLFELRGQTYRQFAIYRVAGGQATQVFVTQPTAIN